MAKLLHNLNKKNFLFKHSALFSRKVSLQKNVKFELRLAILEISRQFSIIYPGR